MTRLVGLLFCLFATSAGAADVLGISLPLSGRFAALGGEMEMGMLKAIEDHARTGGRRPRIALVDDRCETAGGVSGLETLREREAEIVIGVPCFEPALVYGDALDVPILAVGLRHAEVEDRVAAGRLTVLGASPDAEAVAAADLILPRWRNTPFAIVDDGGVYGRALAGRLQELAAARGLRPQLLATFRPLQSTQAALVRRLANAGIQAVFVAGEAEDAATIARDAKRLGNMTVATGESGALLPFVDGAAETPAILTATRPSRRDLPQTALLAERMDVRGDFPSDPFLEGYALAQVALDVLNTGADLRAATFDTVLGELDFSSGRAASQPFALHRWNGETLEPIAR